MAAVTHGVRLHGDPFPTLSSGRHTQTKRKILKGEGMSALRDRVRARHSRVASITIDDLRALFHLPLQTAADQLGISETMVKRVSRKFGVKKWPYRQVHWIDAQIDALRPKAESGEDSGSLPSPRHCALQLLMNARMLVFETGEVPTDLVQRLHRGMKHLTRQESSPRSLHGWRSPTESLTGLEVEMETETDDTWMEEWSQSTASLSPRRWSPRPSSSAEWQQDGENDLLLANSGEDVDVWSRVLNDEALFEDPSMVLENVAAYLFDAL